MAERYLGAALSGLADDDPLRAAASFALGALRITGHETRCAVPCPAAAELRPIVALLAAAGERDQAPTDQLYPYAMTVDKLYEHTGDPADIDLAINVLQRVTQRRDLAREDSRQALICLAMQHLNRGEALAKDKKGPGSAGWADFGAAIEQLEVVLTMLSGRGRRSDSTRVADLLTALVGLIEAYYRRSDQPSDAELDDMAVMARRICAEMTPDYRLRGYALGRSGVVLTQRLARMIGDPWDDALNSAIMLGRIDSMGQPLTRIAGAEADLDLSIDALTQAVGREDYASRLHPLFVSALCTARVLRYLARQDDEDLREMARLGRIVMGHPHTTDEYKRVFGDAAIVELAQRLDVDVAGFPTAAASEHSPTGAANLDVVLGMLRRLTAADQEPDAELSTMLAMLMGTQIGTDLADAELADAYRRLRETADTGARGLGLRTVLLLAAAITGTELIRRGTGPANLAADVALVLQQAGRGLPATHPLASTLGPLTSAFEAARRGAGHQAKSEPTVPPRSRVAQLPADAEAFDLRAAALLGAASHGRLAVAPGVVIETVEKLLSGRSRSRDRLAPAAHAILALALHTRWLRERTGPDLGAAIEEVRRAIGLLPPGHPLCLRLRELLAGMLLDRCQMNGDHADAQAAITTLEELASRADGGKLIPGLNELLTAAAGDGSDGLRGLLAPLPDGPADAAAGRYGLELEAALASGLLLRALLAGGLQTQPADQRAARPGRAGDDLSRAITILRRVTAGLPPGHPRGPDAHSDLGLASLARARREGSPTAIRAAVQETLAAARECPADHPRRPTILLRAAGALTGSGPAGYDPETLSQGVGLLTESLTEAGLDTFGERSRCLYGLGYSLLVRYEHAGDAADLDGAISYLEEARAGLDQTPGDAFLISLLRILAWAYRLAGDAGPGLKRRQSRSIGRSLLHEHARAVLLQSSSEYGLAAARRIGADTLRLADWCLADGQLQAAIEALELGRGLVLHAATVAADVPALLRDAGHPDLAREWETQIGDGAGRDLSAVPSDLRHRVLSSLAHDQAEQRLLSVPTVAQIADALLAIQMDALVYLLPETSEGSGHALIVAADGTVHDCPLPGLSAEPGSAVTRYAAAHHDLLRAQATRAPGVTAADRRRRRMLSELCDWAWTAAMDPVLARLAPSPALATRPPRLVIAPMGTLGVVPWHAARRPLPGGGTRYVCEEVVLSMCVSARQLTEVAGRRVLPRGQSPVLVANPTRDLRWSTREADAIRAALYPAAVLLGRSREGVAAGRGTPEEVLAFLPGGGSRLPPSELHLGCHAVAGQTSDQSKLRLAGGDLTLSVILAQARARTHDSPGGLVVLAACTSDLSVADHDEALTLASAFLAAGASGVVGARWQISDVRTALLMFMLHRHLVRHPAASPADALRAAQLWMLDPARSVPQEMPRLLADEVGNHDLADPHSWAAFTYHGH
jgi:hypothetical protein